MGGITGLLLVIIAFLVISGVGKLPELGERPGPFHPQLPNVP